MLAGLIKQALAEAVEAGEITLDEIPEPYLERPRDPDHGDWATNVAMQSAKAAKMPPRQIAEIIAAHMAGHEDIDAVEIAGPGFINIRLSPRALQGVLAEIHEQRGEYGRSTMGDGRKVQVEFVSANPVGPMHVGHGRWAALGDGIARVLEYTGHEVEREYYINDAGVQMDIFGASVSARYLELCGETVEFPEDGYQGAYITEIAREIFEEEGARWAEAPAEEREEYFREKAYLQVLEHLEARAALDGRGLRCVVLRAHASRARARR